MDVVAFTPRSLDLVTLPPVAGRMFGGEDTPQGCKVVVVNQEAAADFFDDDAVGRSIQDSAGQHVEIVGVVATRRESNVSARESPDDLLLRRAERRSGRSERGALSGS